MTDAEDLALVQDQIQVQGLRGRLTWAARPLLDLAVQVQVASIGLVAVAGQRAGGAECGARGGRRDARLTSEDYVREHVASQVPEFTVQRASIPSLDDES